MLTDSQTAISEHLRLASVLVAAGELDEAEVEISSLLAARPDDLEALSLLAKIKHIRGELSEAFACWARIQAAAPQGESARLRLLSLLQLAQDPERGAGGFLMLGRDHLWRKPSSFLELERVFTLFAKRQPDEARAAAAGLARKYRGGDAEVFKLATLAEALVAELAGDFEEARRILEGLGHERGYEGDLDRVLGLARIYEALGGQPNLERAANICEYLTRTLGSFGEVYNLGRLSAIYRALGREREARDYDARFLAAFRRGMHRPRFADLTAVAAQRYLPLARLATARFVPPAAPSRGGRRRAIGLALTGDRGAARDLFLEQFALLDRKYLAELAEQDGDRDGAVALFLGALAEDPEDAHVAGWLLDHADHDPRIAAHFGSAPNGERARQGLEAALRERPLRPLLWRRRAALYRLRGEEAAAERMAARAAALEEARRGRAIGRSLSAAVYHFVGHGKGLVHEVWADRRPAGAGQGGRLEEILGNVTPEMAAGVRNTFVSVREYARAKLPHQCAGLADYHYGYKVTKEDEPSGGLSAGLPSALAFLSVFLQRPLPQDVASSGALVADAHDVLVVRPIADADLKVRGAYNRDLRWLLLPRGNKADLDASAQVPREVCDEVVRWVDDLDQAVTLVFGREIWLD